MSHKLSINHSDFIRETLQIPEEIEIYLNIALDNAFEKEDFRIFLLALRDVAIARGMKNTADEADLNRENLYRILSEKGNPELSSLWAILKAMGLKISVSL